MTKWCDYLISHTWINASREMTHVLLHEDLGDAVGMGIKMSVGAVMDLTDEGYLLKTVVWNYETGLWRVGSDVETWYEVHHRELRSFTGHVRNDCLEKLPHLNY